MDERTPAGERRTAERIPIDCSVRLEFPDYGQPVKAFASNISENGMFIRATGVKATVSSEFQFELASADGENSVGGIGEVVWIGIGDGGYSGMGVRFLSLQGESRETVRRIVAAPASVHPRT